MAETKEMLIASETTNVISTDTVRSISTDVERDQFGRDASERTVELSPESAEAVNREVEAGKHTTYDEALAYVITRGIAEIKRARDAQQATRDAKRIKKQKESYQALLTQFPDLATKPEFVAKMIADFIKR